MVCINGTKKPGRVRWVYVSIYIVQSVAVRHTYNAVVKTPEQNCVRAMRRLRREYNIKMNLRELLCVGVDWILMAVDRVEWWIFFFEYVIEHWCSLLSS